MYKINIKNGRYFQAEFEIEAENQEPYKIILDIEPCKLKTLRRFTDLLKKSSDDDIVDLFRTVLNKNKTGYVVTIEAIENLTIEEMNEFLLAYFEWQTKEKNSDPN